MSKSVSTLSGLVDCMIRMYILLYTKSSYLVSCQKLNLLDKYNILPQNVVHEMLLQWLCGYIKLPTEDRAYHPPMLVAKFMKC